MKPTKRCEYCDCELDAYEEQTGVCDECSLSEYVTNVVNEVT